MELSACAASVSVSLGEVGAADIVGSLSPVGSGSEFDEQAPSISVAAIMSDERLHRALLTSAGLRSIQLGTEDQTDQGTAPLPPAIGSVPSDGRRRLPSSPGHAVGSDLPGLGLKSRRSPAHRRSGNSPHGQTVGGVTHRRMSQTATNGGIGRDPVDLWRSGVLGCLPSVRERPRE